MLQSLGRGILRHLHAIFSSWRFPAFAISLLVFYNLLMIAMLLVPVTDDSFGRFAEEFKTWCFGYDPATGEMQTMYVVLMITEPVVLGGILALVWWGQLREAITRPPQLVPWTGSALVVVVAGSVAITTMSGRTVLEGELPFPAERLRMAHVPPDFDLIDHEGRPVRLAELRGKVVVVTAIYASCNYTCPMLLGQATRSIEALPNEVQGEVVVVAITLDPERDRAEQLAAMAKAQGVAAPLFRLSTGDPAHVEAVLDRFDVSRKRIGDSPLIDHANLYFVIDRSGRIAYRLTLGDRQEEWLTSALRLLARESAGDGIG